MSFLPRTQAVLDSLFALMPVAYRNGIHGTPMIETQKDAGGDTTLVINGRPFPPAENTPRFSPTSHDRIALTKHAQALAEALASLEAAIRAIPGHPHGDVLGILLRPVFRDAPSDMISGDFCLEAAPICPSGLDAINHCSLPVQAAALASHLDMAAELASVWGTKTLHTWLVKDLPDDRGNGGLVREVLAPDEEGALVADICWHWREAPDGPDIIRRKAFAPKS